MATSKNRGKCHTRSDLGQKLERVVLQDIDTLVIGAEVVNLFPVELKMNWRKEKKSNAT